MIAALISAAVGIAVMAMPALLDFGGIAADVSHVVGPLAATCGIIATSQVLRPLRRGNSVLGAALLASAITLDQPARAAWAYAIAGATLLFLARFPGRQRNEIGGGWSALRVRAAAASRERSRI